METLLNTNERYNKLSSDNLLVSESFEENSIVIKHSNNLYFVIDNETNTLYEVLKENDKLEIIDIIRVQFATEDDVFICQESFEKHNNTYDRIDRLWKISDEGNDLIAYYNYTVTDKHKRNADNKELKRVKKYIV